jgi:hypothetical protein
MIERMGKRRLHIVESYIIILLLDGRVTFLSLSIGQILPEWVILATFYENNILPFF